MYQGNWTCSQCGGAITELPFQPRSEAGLTCRACFMKNKGGGGAPGHGGAPTETNVPVAGSGIQAPSDIPEEAGLATEPPPFDDSFPDATPITPGEKPKFEGKWQCANCGGEITSLPFEPRSTDNLKCLDCFKASKQ